MARATAKIRMLGDKRARLAQAWFKWEHNPTEDNTRIVESLLRQVANAYLRLNRNS